MKGFKQRAEKLFRTNWGHRLNMFAGRVPIN